MPKKEIKELSNEFILKSVKGDFLTLCKMFSRLGEQLHAHLAAGRSKETLSPLVDQYLQIGHQLSGMGMGLDALGGDPVLFPPSQSKYSGGYPSAN